MTRAEMIAALHRAELWIAAAHSAPLLNQQVQQLALAKTELSSILAALTAEGEAPRYRNVWIVAHYDGPGTGIRGVHGSQAGAEANIADIIREYPNYSRRDFVVIVERIRDQPSVEAPRPPDARIAAGEPGVTVGVDLICACERCQIRLPEHLGTYTPGVRGSMAWRCAVCLPIEGPSGRLLRDAVVTERRKRFTKEAPRG